MEDNVQETIYKKVELEEIPDDDEEYQINVNPIEATDFILIDDEPKKTPPPPPMAPKFDPVVSCYEKALAKLADGTEELSTNVFEKKNTCRRSNCLTSITTI